jgi:DNA-binding transcriptional regulator GbsR (MarR family)
MEVLQYSWHGSIIQCMLKPMKDEKAVKVALPNTHPPLGLLGDIEQRFIELWGDMSSWWGVSRTMAEIHGLLYITSGALAAEEIQERLGISRGNVSMNIRTLVEWGLVRKVRRRGQRREYYECLTDVWEMFTVLAAQRKRREIDPIIRTLKDCHTLLQAEVTAHTKVPEATQEHFRRVEDLLRFLLLVENLAIHFFRRDQGLREVLEMLVQGQAPTEPGQK